ncbi:MAG: hypothetical protein ACLQIQ_07825 [Beijerinckiaceae bacterium]
MSGSSALNTFDCGLSGAAAAAGETKSAGSIAGVAVLPGCGGGAERAVGCGVLISGAPVRCGSGDAGLGRGAWWHGAGAAGLAPVGPLVAGGAAGASDLRNGSGQIVAPATGRALNSDSSRAAALARACTSRPMSDSAIGG